jgi:hypothetical protein
MLVDKMQNGILKEGRLVVEPNLDLADVVVDLRKQRNENMVQNKDQFAFIYEFVSNYSAKLIPPRKRTVSNGRYTPSSRNMRKGSGLLTVISSDDEVEPMPCIHEVSVRFHEHPKID